MSGPSAVGACNSPVAGSGKNTLAWSPGPRLAKSPKSGPVTVTRTIVGTGRDTATTVARRAVSRWRVITRWNGPVAATTAGEGDVGPVEVVDAVEEGDALGVVMYSSFGAGRGKRRILK